MPRKILNTLIFALIAVIVAALGYWNIAPDSTRDTQASDEHVIDFYVIGARSVQYQDDGKLHYRMTADKLEHIKSTDITLIEMPKLDLYRGGELPWNVTSKRAEVSPGGAEVELIDEVRIARTDAKNRPTIITSSRMTVIPDKEYAQTKQAVRIVAANGVTTAQGMKAYLNDGRMLLQSNVRGQHEVR
ncbi:LPS export ABC transporter periplasmic protein LptC [Pseudomonas sp. KHPS1]|uniref:LPS export ABC transporter periplasmic protein LptC n=1 Tax=Ectopseudomonas hydrolytica TaxID=2493633 RepID=UPI0020B7BD9A|nr:MULTISPECIES: LPS export ABC transporter periplasmic protein LptC [unclassified Pseudomonas]MBA4244362.1 LPS export ABC transporter periplasmic protein LptC [Pseudomonas sp.]UTH37360.1 LPS export ABC transporter periplasmic protein LptC [Pseudomonas sp. KHPS1]